MNLRTADLIVGDRVGSGINNVYALHESSVDAAPVAVIKPYSGLTSYQARRNIPARSDMERELAAYMVAEHMGIDMPLTVYRTDTGMGPAIVQDWVNGVLGTEAGPQAVRNAENLDMVALFDAIIGNEDRHPGNLFMCGQYIIPIDHGLCFPRPGSGYGNTVLLDMRGQTPLTDNELATIEALAQDEDFDARLADTLQDDAAMNEYRMRLTRMLQTGDSLTEYDFTSEADTPYSDTRTPYSATSTPVSVFHHCTDCGRTVDSRQTRCDMCYHNFWSRTDCRKCGERHTYPRCTSALHHTMMIDLTYGRACHSTRCNDRRLAAGQASAHTMKQATNQGRLI